MDVLLGLDMLKRHQCMIDLKDNCLRMGDHTMTRFLHENELPAHARLHGGDAKSAGTQEEEDREIAEAMDASAREVASSSKEQQQQQQPQKAEQQQQHPPRDPKIQQLIDMGFSEADASAELLNC
uniref:UBA domain-containing protein n=1 Tax=Plectus sambesii TaxID=2011161 RepID=A0A914VSL1_9BILA